VSGPITGNTMRNKSTALLFIFAAAATLATKPLAASPVTYTYTGNDFQVATNPYTTTDFVSGFFTLASPLGDSLALASITPASYSFTDQFQTFSSVSPPPDVTFEVSTDASGNINGWFIDLQSGANIVSTQTTPNQEDFAEDGFVGEGDNFFAEGTWVMSGGGTSTVPEPGNVAWIGLGLVSIGVVRRKMQRRNQPVE
jgi:hypothetical protein